MTNSASKNRKMVFKKCLTFVLKNLIQNLAKEVHLVLKKEKGENPFSHMVVRVVHLEMF